MIVECGNCGKKYRIDPDKLNKISSRIGMFTCTKCKRKVKFAKPENMGEELTLSSFTSRSTDSFQNRLSAKKRKRDEFNDGLNLKKKAIGSPRLRLRSKMTLLFVIFPVILILITDSLLILRMRKLSTVITSTSTRLLTKSGEKIIAEKARAVAKQISLYLFMYPNLNKEHFNNYPEFRNIALQRVGGTGYTYVLSRPTASLPSRIWVHPDEELIGEDTIKSMRKIIFENISDWQKIYDRALKTGEEADGYYYENDNRKKYMVMVPVEDSELYIVSTTYIDEFTEPVTELNNTASQMTSNTLQSAGIMLFATIILIGTIAYFYGNSISKRILNLTNITDRISVGDLEAQIPKYSQDEIGMLAEGIRRMQDSLRLSLKRLRKRAS